MQLATLETAPCGSGRPNCRALPRTEPGTRGLCQIHSAWCPDDHHPQLPWLERSITEQRSFRTGG